MQLSRPPLATERQTPLLLWVVLLFPWNPHSLSVPPRHCILPFLWRRIEVIRRIGNHASASRKLMTPAYAAIDLASILAFLTCSTGNELLPKWETIFEQPDGHERCIFHLCLLQCFVRRGDPLLSVLYINSFIIIGIPSVLDAHTLVEVPPLSSHPI